MLTGINEIDTYWKALKCILILVFYHHVKKIQDKEVHTYLTYRWNIDSKKHFGFVQANNAHDFRDNWQLHLRQRKFLLGERLKQLGQFALKRKKGDEQQYTIKM